MNPCPCGQYGNPRAMCHCSNAQIARYHARISGPLLDRIDIHLEVPSVPYHELSTTLPVESSAKIKERVNQARAIQLQRFKGEDTFCNAQMSSRQLRKFCILGQEENELLRAAMAELHFSARAYDKTLKLARTIADLSIEEKILPEHIAEAVSYRCLDRNWWG